MEGGGGLWPNRKRLSVLVIIMVQYTKVKLFAMAYESDAVWSP